MELNEIMLTSEEMEKVAEAVEAANSWSMAGVENAIARAQVRKMVNWLVGLGSIRLGDTDYVNLTWDELMSIEKGGAIPLLPGGGYSTLRDGCCNCRCGCRKPLELGRHGLCAACHADYMAHGNDGTAQCDPLT